jgi:hypothetical protein
MLHRRGLHAVSCCMTAPQPTRMLFTDSFVLLPLPGRLLSMLCSCSGNCVINWPNGTCCCQQ